MNHPQLPLGLALRDSARFDGFFPGPNREAIDSLRLAAAGQGESLLFVAGPAGMGKTHLLQAACHHAAGNRRASTYLPMQQLLELTPAVLEGLEQLDLVCLDDAQLLAGNEAWEHGLFDLFNRLREAGGTLVVAAEQRPDLSGFGLPDLVSRLGWGVTYVLRALDDADMLAALTCRAAGRGLELPEETASFLLKRIPRDPSNVFNLLDRLDEASMVERRRLTIPFVKSVLANLPAGSPASDPSA
jgi:DnaA family protein